jgi:hypothetical protein
MLPVYSFTFAMYFTAAFTRAFRVPIVSQSAWKATWRPSLRCSLTTQNLSQCHSHQTILSVPTADDMEDVGGILASLLLEAGRPEGAIVLLEGDLGAGKTSFARGFVRGATGDWNLRVTSPTFLLSNTYRARKVDENNVESDIEYVLG